MLLDRPSCGALAFGMGEGRSSVMMWRHAEQIMRGAIKDVDCTAHSHGRPLLVSRSCVLQVEQEAAIAVRS